MNLTIVKKRNITPSRGLQADVVSEIFDALAELANVETNSALNTKFRFYHHYSQIRGAVARGEKIKFLLPAFPAKSANRSKTISDLPDLAEYLGLLRLENVCHTIEEIYEPGAEVLICSDGRVFSNLVGIDDENVTLYNRELKKIISSYGFSHISLFNLEDFFTDKSFDEMREALDETYAEPLQQIKMRVKNERNEMLMFNGIHRFLLDDFMNIDTDNSKNKIRKYTKDLAYKVIQRSHAWSELVGHRFPEYIRLSIHPQEFGSKKFPVRLVMTDNHWRTPWHSVALFNGKEFRLCRKEEAVSQNAKQKSFGEGLFYYSLV